MAQKVNKNDRPLKSLADLSDQVRYSRFEFSPHFSQICVLTPNATLERLEIASTRDGFSEKGLVYVLCIAGKILKIGCTITDFSKRVQSYNCGRKKFRASGTCSTTNFFILQSLLNINKPVRVYAYFPALMEYDIFGTKGTERFPSPKAVEKEVLSRFAERHGQVPIGCTQR